MHIMQTTRQKPIWVFLIFASVLCTTQAFNLGPLPPPWAIIWGSYAIAKTLGAARDIVQVRDLDERYGLEMHVHVHV